MEKKLKEDIIRAAASVRKKYRQLNRGMMEEEIESKRRFEPLLKPLETIIDLTKGGAETSEQEEIEETPVKVKKENVRVKSKAKGKVTKKGKKRRLFQQSEEEEEDESIAALTPHKKHLVGTPSTPFMTPGLKTPYSEEVFEDTVDLPQEDLDYLKRYGPLGRKYLIQELTLDPKMLDRTFGVRPGYSKGVWRLGNKQIDFDKDDYVVVGGDEDEPERFLPSEGFYELLFKKFPLYDIITENDKKRYKKILKLTSAHLQNYNPDGRLASSGGSKYNSIIKGLFSSSEGRGFLPVTNNKIDYIYWNKADELIQRLALLLASERAGNTGHRVEITSIEEELKEQNIIV